MRSAEVEVAAPQGARPLSIDQPSRSRASSTDQMVKRPRANSISSRLRAASDLEEHGYIDKYQKGVFKDLIISGDSAMQSALDKYEQSGDISDLQALIAKTHGRRQSIDILEGLDLDFLHVRRNLGGPGSFDGDMFFDTSYIENGGHLVDPFRENRNVGPTHNYQDTEYHNDYDPIAASLHNFQHPHGDLMMYSGNHNYGENNDRSSYLATFPHEERERLGSFAIDDNGRDRASSFAVDGFGRDRFFSTGSVGEITRGRFDSNISETDRAIMNNNANIAQSSRTDVKVKTEPRVMSKPRTAHVSTTPRFLFFERPTYAEGSTASGEKHIGAYSPEARRKRIERFLEKRKRRVWTKKVKYDVRKNFADSRLRVKGRFVKKEDEEVLRELMDI
jgi:hypothetical protein